MTAWCPACGSVARSWADGPGGRPDAACRSCGSLERHRTFAIVLDLLAPVLAAGTVVEIAPTPAVRELLLRHVGRDRYLGFDLGLDARTVDLYADVTRMPFRDASLRALVCFHVLEHVPDDAAAMRELRRVVADDGVVIVNNPWRRDRATDEDPAAPVDERIRRFGQHDHVRLYGTDFEDRLRSAGFHVDRFESALRLPTEVVVGANLAPVPLWFLTVGSPAGDAVRTRLAGLTAGPGSSALLAAAAADPVVFVGTDLDAVGRVADDSGLDAVLHTTGLARSWARLVERARASSGRATPILERLATTIDSTVRDELGLDRGARWGVVDDALPDDPDTVRTLLRGLPRLRVVLVRRADDPWHALDDVALTSPAGQVITVDPLAGPPGGRLRALVGCSDTPGEDHPHRAGEDLEVEHG